MHVTAKVDYAVRALVEIAANRDRYVSAEEISRAQEIPLGFLRRILTDLRRAGLVVSHQGATGGFELARPADRISLADAIRSVEGPLAHVRGIRPNDLAYEGSAEPLQQVWVAVRANLRMILEQTTLADVAGRRLPSLVRRLAADPQSWAVPD